MLYEAVNISKSFDSSYIIDNFSLQVEPGEFVSLVGRSGSGLTLILQILAGIVKPSEGEIYYNDKLVGSAKSVSGLCKLRREKIGYISTEPILLPDKTVYENLLMAMSHRHLSGKLKQEKAKSVLKMLGLKGLGRYYPNELNIVEKQKVCIGRAIINEPDIVFCDEPTDVLEGYGAEQIMEILEILNSAGYAIVMSTHSKRIASRSRRVVPVTDDIDLTSWEELIYAREESENAYSEELIEEDSYDEEYEDEYPVDDEEVYEDEFVEEPEELSVEEEFGEYAEDKSLGDMSEEEREEALKQAEEQAELDRLSEAIEFDVDELVGANGFPEENVPDMKEINLNEGLSEDYSESSELTEEL